MQCRNKLTRITERNEKWELSEETFKKKFEYLLGAAVAITGAGAAVVGASVGSEK